MTSWKVKLVDSIIGLSPEKLVLLIQYGSRDSTSDSDYLAIYDGFSMIDNLKVGRLDIVALSRDVLTRYMNLMDPMITEPLLKGNRIFGDSKYLKTSLDKLNQIRPTDAVIRFLLCRSTQQYIEAYNISIEENDMNKRLSRRFWSALSFSISYWCFASHYQLTHSHAISLFELLQSMPTPITKIWNAVIDSKKCGNSPSLNALTDWARFLIRTP